MMTKSKLLEWIAEKRKTADRRDADYLDELAAFVRTAADRRGHMSWGAGDVEHHPDKSSD